jgi:hypothetical protein
VDWESWQTEIEEQIRKLQGLETTFSYEKNYLLPAKSSVSIRQFKQQIGYTLPDDFVEFYQRFDEVSLPDVWNSYFVSSLEQILRFPTPNQLQSPEYNGRMLIFGSDAGGNSFCIFFGAETQPILYLPATVWEDDLCIYQVVGGKYLSPKWLAQNFSAFLQRVLDDTKAYIRNDSDWQYMDYGLYDQKNI